MGGLWMVPLAYLVGILIAFGMVCWLERGWPIWSIWWEAVLESSVIFTLCFLVGTLISVVT